MLSVAFGTAQLSKNVFYWFQFLNNWFINPETVNQKKSISSSSFGKVSWIRQTSVSKKKHLARSRIIHLLSNIFLPNELDRGGCYNKGVGFLYQGQYYIVFRYSLFMLEFERNIYFPFNISLIDKLTFLHVDCNNNVFF